MNGSGIAAVITASLCASIVLSACADTETQDKRIGEEKLFIDISHLFHIDDSRALALFLSATDSSHDDERHALLSASAFHGNPIAAETLAHDYIEGTATERDLSAARYWFRVAAELGSPSGIFYIACDALRTESVGASATDDYRRRQIEIIRLAARRGNVFAMLELQKLGDSEPDDQETDDTKVSWRDRAKSRYDTMTVGELAAFLWSVPQELNANGETWNSAAIRAILTYSKPLTLYRPPFERIADAYASNRTCEMRP
jgi:TPR repeat protein